MWLDNARIMAICAVVVLHTAASAVIGSDIGSASWWAGNIYDSLVRWCVPVFVMLSGALLLDPAKQEGIFTFYRKRASRVLIPMLFWSLFFLLWTSLQSDGVTVISMLKLLLAGKPYYHMWFLYMIVTLYLFTPFFRKIVAHASHRELSGLVLLLFTLSAADALTEVIGIGSSPLFFTWFLAYLPYFFLGHLIRTTTRDYPRAPLWVVFGISVLLTATGCYLLAAAKGLHTGLYFYNYLSITVIPMAISAMLLLKAWSTPVISARFTKKAAALTLGVYLIHPVFLEIPVDLGLADVASLQTIAIPCTALVTVLLSFAAAWVISHTPYLKRVI